MDDFGSGYSSLNMLNQMPIDILKLDMKFIQSETAKPMNQGVLRFIMELARWMRLGVVAEGVETKAQLERLRETGCDYVQGYYFAKPMPAAEFGKMLEEQASPALESQRMKGEGGPGEEDKGPVLLIADEDPEYRDRMREAFSGYYRIVEAKDDTSALKCIEAYAHELEAAVLSITLPKEAGDAVLRTVKRDRRTWNIPVIVTGKPDMELEQNALESGAADYAVKPHTPESLLRRIDHAVKLVSFPEKERALKEKAQQDPLTSVLNRRGWEDALNSLQKEDAPFAFYLFDLDNLKQINDTLGHMEGDRLIREFSKVLRAHTRETDIIARFGGDEFMAVMKKMKSGQAA